MSAPAKTIPPPRLHRPGEVIRPPRICIFGRGGMGKTTLLHTLPGRGFVVDVPITEGGDFVLYDWRDRIQVSTVETWDDIEGVFLWLMHGTHDIQWIAIDSVTGMAQHARSKTLREKNTSLIGDPHVITMQEWGKIGTLTSELIHKFNTLRLPIVWVAQEHSQTLKDDAGNEYKMLGPDVTPMALAALTPPAMFVGRLSWADTIDGKREQRLRIGTHPRYMTKTRCISLTRPVPDVIRNPDLNQTVRYLLGKDDAMLDIVPDDELGVIEFESDDDE